MTTVLSPVLVQKFFDSNGAPLVNGQLFSYQAGTTTPLATYTDSTGNVANANPTILNARGEANIWIPASTAYKFVLEDSAGNTIWTVDNVMGGFVAAGNWTTTLSGPFVSNPTGTLNYSQQGSHVTIWCVSGITAAVNLNSDITASGLPSSITPSSTRLVVCAALSDGISTAALGVVSVNANNTLSFKYVGPYGNNPAGGANIAAAGLLGEASNTRGISAGWSITYSL